MPFPSRYSSGRVSLSGRFDGSVANGGAGGETLAHRRRVSTLKHFQSLSVHEQQQEPVEFSAAALLHNALAEDVPPYVSLHCSRGFTTS